MPRIPHGASLRLEALHAVIAAVHEVASNVSLPFNFIAQHLLTDFGYMFDDLQNQPGSLLPDSTDAEVRRTVDNLKRLGATMMDTGQAPDSAIPALYTYFGQFVAHDISFEAESRDLSDPTLKPLTADEVRRGIKNTRTATLDLDSVYGNELFNLIPRKSQKPDHLKLGPLSPSGFPPADGEIFNDVPREGYNYNDYMHDRAAIIGDPRNDENVITSQLHVAFLRAHNALVDEEKLTFNQARIVLRQHFQWVVLDDYLRRIADPAVVDEVLADPRPVYDPSDSDFFLPLEFSMAAYRFGHAMIRESYHYNHAFNNGLKARLGQLFIPLEDDWRTLPDQWVIGWENFVDDGRNMARRIDTQLVEPLSKLLGGDRKPLKNEMARLAVRNLLRGYMLRMPTGQAVARALGRVPLTEAEIEGAAAHQEQRTVLRDSGFTENTPLWFYILAEAAHTRARAEEEDRQVDHLGPVGSRIVAEVLVGLIRRSQDSILRVDGWEPTLPKEGDRFKLPDILRLAGVLG